MRIGPPLLEVWPVSGGYRRKTANLQSLQPLFRRPGEMSHRVRAKSVTVRTPCCQTEAKMLKRREVAPEGTVSGRNQKA